MDQKSLKGTVRNEGIVRGIAGGGHSSGGHDWWVGRQGAGGAAHRGRRGASCVALPRPVTPKTDVFVFLPSDTR